MRVHSSSQKPRRRLSPVKEGPLNERVYQVIREGIYSGRFKPGEMIRELRLAAELQVSQATVREALLRLERASLVSRIPNKGTQVTILSEKQFRERMELRCLLEGIAAVEAAKRMTEEDFQELKRLERAFSQAWSRKAYFDLSQAEFQFHHLIWERSQNESLCQVLDFLVTPMFAFMSVVRSLNPGGSPGMPHAAITDALREGGEGKIKEAIANHIRRYRGKSIEQYLRPIRGRREPAIATRSSADHARVHV
ncbi:MAG: GntR family transcriptional regulator [Acidobacteria bacterium]|nr:GntR family transcriptional regulator [Acidobacteriota bacterium]